MDPITPAATLITKLWDSVAIKLALIVDAGDNVRSLLLSMNQLKDKSIDVANRVSAAKAQLLTPTQEVLGWLRRVEELVAEVSAIEQDFLNQPTCFCSCHYDLSSSYRIGREANRKASEATKMLARSFDVVATYDSAPAVALDLPAPPDVGVESPLENALFDDQRCVIGVHGMGGVGKTTLLRRINNSFVGRSDFDLVIMVEASLDFKIEQLQQAIADRVGLPLSKDGTSKSWAIEIKRSLNSKKFLLLLDNIWNPINLTEAGIPIRQSKCKTVISSRYESTCAQMGAEKMIKMGCLTPDKAWELFRQNLSGGLLNDPEIEDLAKQLAEDCNGLPLALVVISATMSTRITREEWQYAVGQMSKMRLGSLVPLDEASLIPTLKLSYDNLPNDQLKLCFLSCSFYPRGHSILKEELIESWMGLGFLEEHNDINEIYQKGHFLIGQLREASLVVPGDDERRVKVHDIIRALALQISRVGSTPRTEKVSSSSSSSRSDPVKIWLVEAGTGLTDICVDYLEGSSIERLSLMHNSIDSLPEKTDFPELLSLMLQCNDSLPRVVPQGFFKGMGSLQYLDLSNTTVEDIHGIDQLLFLEHLNLSGTPIRKLPRGIRFLGRLRYLYLINTYSLEIIFAKSFSGLHNLRVLNAYASSFRFWATDGAADVDRASLSELNELMNLKALGISVGTHSTFQQLFDKSIPIRYLYISDQDINIPFDQLRLPSTLSLRSRSKIDTSLLEMTIEDCKDLKVVTIGEDRKGEPENVDEGFCRLCTFKGLEKLQLLHLSKLSDIMWKGVEPCEYFPRLRLLRIVGCDKLRSITWTKQLPDLVKLYISGCSEVQQIIAKDDEREGREVFPRLKEFILTDLPRLTSIYQRTLPFPYLVSLQVFRCPKLASLPFGEGSARRLQEIHGRKQWWENLKWANNNVKASFGRHFKQAAS